MKSFVIDYRLALSWFFKEESYDYSEKVFYSILEYKAIAPEAWIYQAATILSTSVRNEKITLADSSNILEKLTRLPIEIVNNYSGADVKQIHALSCKYNLNIEAAGYLFLAMQKGLDIATIDEALVKAANHSGVKIFEPSINEE